MTYLELFQKGSRALEQAGVTEYALDARLLLFHVCDLNHTAYFLRQREQVPEECAAAYCDCIDRRCQRIPLQHITGEAEFMGLTFHVNSSVLVPRQDTEVLVEALLPDVKGKDVLDVCTGSGCIAISLSCLGGCQSVTASDISKDALQVAAENVELNQAKVQLVESDLFDRISGRYDIVVSNPPYIPSAVIEELEPEVRDHDPRLALDGREDGLYFYRRICQEAPVYLKQEGILAVEIGHDQGEAVSEMFRQAGFVNVKIGKDLSGLDRYVWGRLADK